MRARKSSWWCQWLGNYHLNFRCFSHPPSQLFLIEKTRQRMTIGKSNFCGEIGSTLKYRFYFLVRSRTATLCYLLMNGLSIVPNYFTANCGLNEPNVVAVRIPSPTTSLRIFHSIFWFLFNYVTTGMGNRNLT